MEVLQSRLSLRKHLMPEDRERKIQYLRKNLKTFFLNCPRQKLDLASWYSKKHEKTWQTYSPAQKNHWKHVTRLVLGSLGFKALSTGQTLTGSRACLRSPLILFTFQSKGVTRTQLNQCNTIFWGMV